jgi:hypothetical protein
VELKSYGYYFLNLIDSESKNKTLCLEDPKITTINDTNLMLNGILLGRAPSTYISGRRLWYLTK